MGAKTEEDYLSELVGFATVSADKIESKKCAQHCADFFENKGLLTIIVDHDGYPSVIATTSNTKTPKIFLYCHLDVVPAKPGMFILKKSAVKLSGRGAIDMKFACASYMKLLDELGSDVSKYNFGIMLVFDEEIGGRNGAEALLDDGFGCEVCILPDSGGNWKMECDAKGPWFIKISKTGKNAHGSMAFEGINAAELLLPAVNEILSLRDGYAYQDLSLNLTMNASGRALNQIPDYAEAVFDIRFINDATFEKIKSQINAVCTKYEAELETLEFGNCLNIDKNNHYVKKYLLIAEKILDRKIPFATSSGANDGRYFCAHGIPCIITQPGGGGMHSDQEWIERGGMEKLTAINLQFIKQYAKIV